MGRGSNGGALLQVRLETIILLSALSSFMLASAPSLVHGLPVDPLLDRVVTVTQLKDSKAPPLPDNNRSLDQPVDTPRRVTASTPSNGGAAILSNEPAVATVITEPLEVLSPLEVFDRRQNTYFTRSFGETLEVPLPVSVSSKTTPASILLSTDHGWKVFGVAWYVWGLAGIGSAYATRWVLNRQWWRWRV